MKKVLTILIALFMTAAAIANNVVINNVTLVGSAGNFRVQFNLSWENGWHVSTGQNNYDGVWVFFKVRSNGGSWFHLPMTGTNNVLPANYTAYQTSVGLKAGAIIHRTNDFAGTSTLTGVELGIVDVNNFNVEVVGFAIEMVYVPECLNCILGDGNGSQESQFSFHTTNNTSGPLGSVFRVDGFLQEDPSNDPNPLDDAVLINGLQINGNGITGNANFPTGEAFWSMKYEITQGAYRDFLNTLTVAQQTSRTVVAPNSVTGTLAMTFFAGPKNFIEIASPANGIIPALYGVDGNNNNIYNESNDGEFSACNQVSWPDIAAFLDWAGLAPMSEIMYERACRGASTLGVNPSILGEYAWGTNTVFASTYTFSGVNAANEVATNSSATLGNAIYTTTSANNGQMRNGVFATNTSNRATSGASFYGIMEMSGNLREALVTVGNTGGRGFTGLNGDGTLSTAGNANVANWPCSENPGVAPNCTEVTGSAGTMRRGGSWSEFNFIMRVSDRGVDGVSRGDSQGGRGVLYIN